MRIVIAGAGLIGSGLAARLAGNRHDVTVIDKDVDTCERVYAELGVATVHGSATSISTLEDAEVRRADCVAATMRLDSDNMCFSLLARHMGVERIIARMRDPRYEEAYRLAGVTRVLNIAELYLNLFSWEIEEPDVREVTTFGEGHAAIVFVRVPERSRAAGRTVADIAQGSEFPLDCVIAGIFRPEKAEFIIPRGPVVIQADDRLYLAAPTSEIRKAVAFIQGK